MSASQADPRIFIDTSAFSAAVDARDTSHAFASATMRALIATRRRFFTTNAVLFELHGLLLNQVGRGVAQETLRELRASQSIVRVRERDEQRAEEILVQFHDKAFSLTDSQSFAVMERLGICTAYSLDRHCARFGWDMVALEEVGR